MFSTKQTQPAASSAPPGERPAIEAVDLVKAYGRGERAVDALRGVSFAAPAGGILGLLGPNGAGKTTAVKILTTLSTADSGRATVAGIDVTQDPAAIRRIIGYVPQKPCFDPNLTGRENLTLQARIRGMSRTEAAARVTEMLAQFALTDAADRVTTKWSGGMQRKLDVAMGLLHRPRVLFLDEPTTGLDPESRNELWAAMSTMATTADLTVLLTTHYLEEADQLADHVVIIDGGTVVVAGTPEGLKDDLAGDTIHVQVMAASATTAARTALENVAGVDQIRVDTTHIHARAADTKATLPKVMAALEAADIQMAAVTVARPSLEQVYFHHTGRSFQSASEGNARKETVVR